MAGAFNHDLHTCLMRAVYQLAEYDELTDLEKIGSVGE
jgi:hypothetical protein